ncbi:MAG: hypothetical protein ABI361_06115 [Nitrososphaera sp.]
MVPKLVTLLLVAGLVSLSVIPVASSFAQSNPNSNKASAPIYSNNTTLKGNQTGIPVLEKTSDKGLYRVQLKWDSTTVNPQGAFDMQVLFLNPVSPHTNSTNFPQKESNYSGYGPGTNKTAMTVPGIIDRPIAVDSYDLTIYDTQGKVLFQKAHQPGAASASGVTVTLGNYTGPVTLDISNIKAAANALGTTTASNSTTSSGGQQTTDSVKFSATVAPEFPIGTVSVAAGIMLIAIIATYRLKRGTGAPLP